MASNAGGSYDNYLKVSLSCDDGNGSGCENIYYTLDGSTVSTTSSVYTAPFEITSDTTVSFMARDLKGNTSVAYSEVYIIKDTLAPEVTANPASGYANNVTEINLNCAEDCKAIYYTLDGSPATQSSILYSAPITITQDTTLHFIAVDVAGNISDVDTMAYI
ncbi:MAG: chitobiase/beta-hexosaminidase C-terminal domain-containing protein, partial [Candidatus Hydrothermarchaeales archaeon]